MNTHIETVESTENDKGFTLVELLIVIVILGILATVTVFAVSGISDRGKQSACDADYSAVQTAAEAYYAQNGSYAALEADLVTGGLLASQSSKYDYAGVGGSYTITATAGGDCV